MGQKVTTHVVDKSRQDMAKFRLWVLVMKLLHKIDADLMVAADFGKDPNLNTAKIDP